MDRTEAGTVPGSHVLVQALDGVCPRELTEFLVHVMCAGPGVVTEPDTEVLDLQRFLLVDLGHKRAKHRTECQRMYCQSRPPATLTAGWETYNVDANDLAIGLFNLLQLSIHISTRVRGAGLVNRRTLRNTRNAI